MSNDTQGPGDLTDEEYREYEWLVGNNTRIYRITDPTELYFRQGGSTHRVVDSKGIIHCLPAPGKQGCVLRWKVKPGKPSVAF